ncbi:MAG: 50S ribosome-binding GTPase [Nanoarchaeota archaeon]|nr:50S ribosome-binding GTPase [Nanoarchaeota archaeon]MBU1644099.1 50S ribosome-binding GTPase [Nanoarchaeota archaeon]MBU1976725.1 50S ribosome-binding GTPase [Nanoarchaeota archaeon]
MPSFWKHVNQVLKEAEIIIEVLDARSIEETRNKEIEKKIESEGKKILFVINKSDLVDLKKAEAIKKTLKPSLFISSKDHLGTTLLKKKILEMSRGEKVTVGILGYPNVGKSSLINALSGRGSARTSAESGYTKGLQKIKVDNKILVIDTPGVFPRKEKDSFKHGKTGAIDSGRIKDPEFVALSLIEEEKTRIKKHYGLKEEDSEKILEEIAFKFKRLIKGGKPDTDYAARFLLKEWQNGKIK